MILLHSIFAIAHSEQIGNSLTVVYASIFLGVNKQFAFLATFRFRVGFCVFHTRNIPERLEFGEKFVCSSEFFFSRFPSLSLSPTLRFFSPHSLSLCFRMYWSLVYFWNHIVQHARWIDVKFDWITKFEIDAGLDYLSPFSYSPRLTRVDVLRIFFTKDSAVH